VVAGGPENNEAFDAGSNLGDGAQTPEAHEARDRADSVLSDLFAKYEGNPEAVGVPEGGAGLSAVGNGRASDNGQPMGTFDPNAQREPEPQAQPAQAQPAEPVQTDAELLLEPIIHPGDEPDHSGVPSPGDPEQFQDPVHRSANAAEMARHALLRSGFLPSEVDAMDEDTLISRGMSRHEVLARDDDAHRRLRTGEPMEAAPQPPSPAEPAEAGVPAVDPMDALLEPLLEPVGEEGVAAVKKLLSVRETKLMERIEALEGRDEQRTRTRIDELVATSRKGWVERFPQLQGGKVAGLVQRRMGLLVKDPAFQMPGASDQERSDRIMLSACLSLGLQDSGASRRRATQQETRRRKTAGTQPTKRVQKDAGEDPITSDQRSDGILEKLFSGDIQGAREFGLRTAR